jgi:hypothetical protein
MPYMPAFVIDPIFETKSFLGIQKKCIVVVITGNDYLACDNSSKDFWSNKKRGSYGRGLKNSKDDPCLVTRIGLFGQTAFGICFRQDVDFEYREFGDEYDNKINGITYDIKCATKKTHINYILHTNEYGTKIPLDKDIYVFGYLEKEDKNQKEAMVVLTGYLRNEDILRKSFVRQSPIRNANHVNYEILCEDLHPIENLYNLMKKKYWS